VHLSLIGKDQRRFQPLSPSPSNTQSSAFRLPIQSSSVRLKEYSLDRALNGTQGT